MVRRIALWCAPSQHRSPLLRAFSARGDCAISDEPLAAAYLAHTRRYHSATGPLSLDDLDQWNYTVGELLGPVPAALRSNADEEATLWVQKHVAKQLLLHTDREWLRGFRHVFVLRDPGLILAESEPDPALSRIEDTCVPHQLEIYRWVKEHLAEPPIVLCETALLRDPERILTGLCEGLGIRFDRGMLGSNDQRDEGDACWYTEASERARVRAPELERAAEQHGDVLRRCEIMLAELREHDLCASCPVPAQELAGPKG